MSEIALLYVTTPTHEVALTISHALVAEKLAACTNILGAMTAIYRWEGRVTEGAEVAMIIKTTAQRADAVISRIQALHPYECPAIVHVPVNGGFSPFLAWVAQESTA